MTRRIASKPLTVNGPGADYQPVAPSDAADLPEVPIALYAEGGGAIRFVSLRGETRIVTVPDFGWVMCGVTAVRATGTTATGIHAVVID